MMEIYGWENKMGIAIKDIIKSNVIDESLTDLKYLENDYTLLRDGYQFTYILTYTELYRYLYPVLEYLRSKNKSVYYTRQLALRYILEFMDQKWIIFRDSLDQYRYEINLAYKTLASEIYSNDYDWGSYQVVVNEVIKQMKDIKYLENYFDKRGVPLSKEKILSSVYDGLKAEVFKKEYQNGIRIFESLITSRRVSALPSDFELGIESDKNMRIDYEDILEKIKPDKSDEISRLDRKTANILAKTVYLNKMAPSTKQIYVIVVEKILSSDVYQYAQLDSVLLSSSYGSRLPLHRSLNYCIYDAYFRAGSEEKFENLRKKVEHFRDVIDTELSEEISEDEVALMKRKKIDILKKLYKVREQVHRLPSSSGFLEKTEEHIRSFVSIREDTKTPDEIEMPIISSEVRNRIIQLLKTPEILFNSRREFDKILESMKLRLAQIRREIDKIRIIRKEVTIYGVYNRDIYTPKEKKSERAINNIYIKLADWKLNDWKTLDDIEDECKLLLFSKIKESPALYIALAICDRRRNRFDESLSRLEIAVTLMEGNPEAYLEYSRNFRKLADREPEGSRAYKDHIKKAVEYSEMIFKTRFSIRPIYYQHMAYMLWRQFLLVSQSFREVDSEEGLELISRAAILCKTGSDIQYQGSERATKIYKGLICDYAYFLSLLGKKDQGNIIEARRIIDSIEESKLNQAQYDSKAFIYLKYYDGSTKKDINLLEDAIRLYLTAISFGNAAQVVTDGLYVAMNKYKDAGGKIENLVQFTKAENNNEGKSKKRK